MTNHVHNAQTIETAVRAGLNYVDTSPFYGEGKSEEVLGRMMMILKILIILMIGRIVDNMMVMILIEIEMSGD